MAPDKRIADIMELINRVLLNICYRRIVPHCIFSKDPDTLKTLKMTSNIIFSKNLYLV